MRGIRYICAAVVLLFGLFACSEPQEEAAFLDVQPEGVSFSALADEKAALDVHTNASWSLEVSPPEAREWLSAEPASGGAGVFTVRLTAPPNEGYESREAAVYVDAGGLSRMVRIVQQPLVGISSGQREFDVGQPGGRIRIVVFANTEPDVAVTGDWIHRAAVKAPAALAAREYAFAIDENRAYEPRKGKIVFSDPDGSTADTVLITQQAAVRPLVVTTDSLIFSAANTIRYLTVETTEAAWNVEILPAPAPTAWCSVQREGNRIKVRVATNFEARRKAVVRVTAGAHTTDIPIVQQAFDAAVYYGDGQVVSLQQASVGRGVDLILMGDGYTLREMERGSGKYEQEMRAAADHFFSVYPYSAYREYFNVYMVTAVSEEAGMSCVSPELRVDTKFSALWQGGNSTSISCDDAAVRKYAAYVTALTGRAMRDMTVIMPINRDVYAGTCLMWTDGFSIAMIPAGASFARLVTHEAGGHGFAKLLDEYIYYDAPIPADIRDQIVELKAFEFYINADFSPDIAATTWSGFANHPKYPMVGTFPGAYMYSTGIWRPEENSCMNDNAPYYNAPSRWMQVKRIRALSGNPCTFEEFLLEDAVPQYPAAAGAAVRRYPELFVPSGPPVVVTTPSEDLSARAVGAPR